MNPTPKMRSSKKVELVKKADKSLTTATVRIKGTRPILFHAFCEDVLSDTKRKSSGNAGNNPEEWKDTVTMDEDRHLYVTGMNLFSMLKNAAKHTKIGRGTISAKVGATLQIAPKMYYLKERFVPTQDVIDRVETKPVYLHVCSVKNPNTKGRNLRYRVAASPGWEVSFDIEWDERIVSRQHMLQVCQDAGILEGLNDGRSIGFGRFDVISFELID